LLQQGHYGGGVLGVLYFEYISFVGHIESVLHRAIWTSLFLVITTSYLSKWSIFFEIIKIKKNLITLFFSGLLIFINWAVWIYAVSSDQIINASFGYFIMPILSVFLGYIFFKEKLNVKRIVSICFVLGSIFFLLIFNFQSLPWVGLIVALSWGFYNLLRKKISVDTDIGLLIESLFMLPFALVAFYVLTSYGLNDFNLSNISLSLILLVSGSNDSHTAFFICKRCRVKWFRCYRNDLLYYTNISIYSRLLLLQ
jgi:chloramphenicol-sensitive protein RarD